ncbi:hypothetical protein [Sphingomonas sp. R86521]|uniref:hypothetical protein n=1 Tax=Sphingomonas sp. R86521 TaxID=3093860 RepID=UPI0036D38780
MSVAAGRFVSGAGTLVNIGLATLGWIWWRLGEAPGARLAGWILVVINGLTSFGYLIFSAAFGIGGWNGASVMAGVVAASLARGVLALVDIGGYYAIVRASARMVSGPLIIARFMKPSMALQTLVNKKNCFLRSAALVAVVVFGIILGPGLRLQRSLASDVNDRPASP